LRFAFLFLLLPVLGVAGFCTAPRAGDTRHEFQILAGYSPGSTTGWGSTEGRRFLLAGLEYRYRCWAGSWWSVSYTGGAFPVSVMFQDEARRTAGDVAFVIPKRTVYGGSVMPLGFTFDALRQRRAHPFAEALGGVVASLEPIPQQGPNATGLNFMLQFGGGVRWKVKPRHAVTVGYKFVHISNGYTTSFNPGLDNHVIYAGFSWLR
jgi:lipid A 3-O-deacylase PagL